MKKLTLVFLVAMALTMVFSACSPEQGEFDTQLQQPEAAVEADSVAPAVEVTLSAPKEIGARLVVARFNMCGRVGFPGDDTCDAAVSPSPSWGEERPICTNNSFVWYAPDDQSYSLMVYRGGANDRPVFVSVTIKVKGETCGTFSTLMPGRGYLWRFGDIDFSNGVGCNSITAEHGLQLQAVHQVFADDGLRLDPQDKFFPASFNCVSITDSQCARDVCGAKCAADDDCQRGWQDALGYFAQCVKGHCYRSEPGCDDDIPCTKDTYVQGKGCVHTPNNTFCDDGDPSTTDECRVVYPESWLSGCYNE